MEVLQTTIAPGVAPPIPQARAAEAQILGALDSSGSPLTLMQLHARTGVPVPELQLITGRLCALRSIRRLNTIIESFCLNRLD